jgi:hypothetical protein
LGWIAEYEAGHGVGGLGVHAGDDVAVDIKGDGDGGVAEALADHLGRDACGQRRGGVAVADIMQPARPPDPLRPRATAQEVIAMYRIARRAPTSA